MNRLPEIGEGVRVPWGLDRVEGEVINVIPPDHAVVAIFGEDSDAHELADDSVRLRIDVLEELEPWKVVNSRKGKPAPGADAERAWWITAARGGQTATVEIRVSGTVDAVDSRSVADESKRALRTGGKSAFAKFARRYRLPRTIVIATTGVFAAPS